MNDNITVREVQERLAERWNPDEIVDVLEVSSAELVEAFPDKIEDRYEQLVQELFDDEEGWDG